MEGNVITTIHSHLTHIARTDEDFVHYGEVIQMAGIGHLGEGALEGALGKIFFDVNQYDWSQDPDRPMLSAIAISSQTGSPSGGFYRLAREKGKLTSKKELDEIEFWVMELTALRKYWQDHSKTIFKGVSVTYQAVYEAFRNFDEVYPNSDDFDQWIDKDGYKYALEFGGKLYPPKHILSVVTGIDRFQFSGGEQTNRVFRQIGLVIVNKPDAVVSHEIIPYSTYLLTWNPGKWGWEDFQEDWESVYAGNRPRFRWICGNTRRIKIGDRVFLMRLGWREQINGIIASGWVTSEILVDQHWSDNNRTALYIEFEPDVLLNPQIDELLDPKMVSRDFNWTPQSSGVSIPNEIASYLEQVWQRHIQRTNLIEAPLKTNESSPSTYIEGSRKLTYSYRYERDPHAREACIAHHGTKCEVCKFDFGKTFGVIGDGFIHVHHLIPISERGTEYTINPIDDLRPVCPNCHAMLHRKSPPFSIAELQYIRQQAEKE